MKYFHISDATGGVVLARVIAIGPVVEMPYGYRFDITCEHGAVVTAVAKYTPGADILQQETIKNWLVGRQQALSSAINNNTDR